MRDPQTIVCRDLRGKTKLKIHYDLIYWLIHSVLLLFVGIFIIVMFFLLEVGID